MSSFTTPLKVEVLDNGKEYKILETFTYYKTNQKHIKIKVEKDFITDFASVPRIFWIFYPPFGTYTKPAVLHDRLCEAFLQKLRWKDVLENSDASNTQNQELQSQDANIQDVTIHNTQDLKDTQYTIHNTQDFYNTYVTRKQADRIFLESMIAINVPFLTRMMLYYSVRIYAIIKYGINK